MRDKMSKNRVNSKNFPPAAIDKNKLGKQD